MPIKKTLKRTKFKANARKLRFNTKDTLKKRFKFFASKILKEHVKVFLVSIKSQKLKKKRRFTSTQKIISLLFKKKSNKTLIHKDLTQTFKLSEYYDLPYNYNQTVVKILFQYPNTLFVYWELDDNYRHYLLNKYGEYLFSDTKPVLKITNTTKNYSFEIDINDYARCWYFEVKDTKCKYEVALGRRPINSNIYIPNNYLFIASSNTIEVPNDHVLLENRPSTIYYKNVKTGEMTSRPIPGLDFLSHFYKFNELNSETANVIIDERSNPSSIFK